MQARMPQAARARHQGQHHMGQLSFVKTHAYLSFSNTHTSITRGFSLSLANASITCMHVFAPGRQGATEPLSHPASRFSGRGLRVCASFVNHLSTWRPSTQRVPAHADLFLRKAASCTRTPQCAHTGTAKAARPHHNCEILRHRHRTLSHAQLRRAPPLVAAVAAVAAAAAAAARAGQVWHQRSCQVGQRARLHEHCGPGCARAGVHTIVPSVRVHLVHAPRRPHTTHRPYATRVHPSGFGGQVGLQQAAATPTPSGPHAL
jgi:hypothetical protein